MTIPLSGMKLHISGLIQDWGVTCAITRVSGTKTAAGRFSGTFVSLASQVLWIQPMDGKLRRDNPGIDASIDAIAYRRFSGTAIKPEDRVLPAGESAPYDVVSVLDLQNHKQVMLRKVGRA